MKREDIKRVDEEIEGMIENIVEGIIENLSGSDYYDDMIEKLENEGVDLGEFHEPSGFLISYEEVQQIKDILISNFSQRFYFSKEDTGEV